MCDSTRVKVPNMFLCCQLFVPTNASTHHINVGQVQSPALHTSEFVNSKFCIQWDLSIADILGPEKQVVIQRFPLFKGYLTRICLQVHP